MGDALTAAPRRAWIRAGPWISSARPSLPGPPTNVAKMTTASRRPICAGQLSLDDYAFRGMDDLERGVAGTLARRPGERFPMRDLAAIAGCSTRKLQEVVNALTAHYGLPIGSSSTPGRNGYWWITDQAELAEAKANLSHRIIQLARRLRALDRSALESLLGQLRLEA